MAGLPLPKNCFLHGLDVVKVIDGRKVWASACGKRLYTWDSLHGEIEAFNKHGFHLGVLNCNGRVTKGAVKGRHLDV
jgi:hypothetical protein